MGPNARSRHPIAARLLALSFGVCALEGCATTCRRPTTERPGSFDAVPPDAVAEIYAVAGLGAATRTLSLEQCTVACGGEVSSCQVSLTPEGPADRPSRVVGTLRCTFVGEEVCASESSFDPLHLNSCPFGCGRLPPHVDPSAPRRADPVIDHFSRVAMLEALSVAAFRQLALDVRRHAPEFAARVARAARDEQRHARRARAVLRAYGARADRVPRVPIGARSIREVALDNAIEGCVRETFGAIVASLQSRRAPDPRMRRFYRAIADDELAHAALSWDLHRVLMGRLPARARERIERAQRRALVELESMPLPHALVRVRTGAPTRKEHQQLVRAMVAQLPFAGA